MKQFSAIVTAVAALLFSSVTFATITKIGVIDMQKVMQTTPKMKEIQQRLEKKYMPRREKLIKMEERLKNDMEKFKRDNAIMGEAEKKELQNKIMQTKQEFDREGQLYQKDLSDEHNKSVQALYEKVKIVVKGIASKGQYDLILQKDAAPYSRNAMDITNQVVKKLS